MQSSKHAKESPNMKRRKLLSLLGMSPALLAGARVEGQQSKPKTRTAQVAFSEAKVETLNPKGTPPPIQLLPMAPRLGSLDGKTVYLVDTGIRGRRISPESDSAVVQQKHAERHRRVQAKSGTVRRRRSGAMEGDQGKGQRRDHGYRALKHLHASDRRSLHKR